MEERLQKGRDVKRNRQGTSSAAGSGEDVEQVYGDVTAMDTDNEAVDPTFDLEASLVSDTDFMTESFCENWVLQLDRDDKVSLALFLSFQLANKGCRGCWCHGWYKIENFKHNIKFHGSIALFVSELHLRQG